MMTLRYWGEYLSDSGVLWRCELHQRGEHVPTELEGFPSEPLTIEWRADGGKMATLHTSAATLNVISKTDRQFLDLYQVEVGVVMLKVYRNSALYWSGSLDPELYEEPYAYKDDYEVMLTFSDFAPLDRIKWSRTGFVTIDEIVRIALQESGVEYSEIRKHISTSLTVGASPLTLSELMVMCANFYDEQGEPMTVREVLEESLKPLALHLVQKNGRILIFDTNALSALSSTPVVWASTDSNLSTDETYNNVTVNFSPYGDSSILKIEMDEKTTATDAVVGTMIFVNYDNTDPESPPAEGFRVFVGDKSDSDLKLLNGARFFRIDSEFSGSDECGVATTIRTMHVVKPHSEYYNVAGLKESTPVFNSIGYPVSVPIIECPSRSVYVPSSYADDFKLKISLDLLFDVRYNPFEQAEEYNEEGNWGEMQRCAVSYVPIILNLLDEDGRVTHHYDNDADRVQRAYKNTGKWVSGEGSLGRAWLCYYSNNNQNEGTGLGGWAKNKYCIGAGLFSLPSKITRMGDGMFIPMPPHSGRIQMIVGSGVHCVRYRLFQESPEHINIHPYVRWVMYRSPAIEIVKKNSRSYEVQDVEHRAWINRNAKEELKIDTLVGTLTEPSPAARGQILDTSQMPVQKLARAGIYDSAERLLIGTAYSAYATRANVLSGTVESPVDYFPMSDRAIDGKYMITSESEHTWADESEITMVEFTADNYEGIDYEKI